MSIDYQHLAKVCAAHGVTVTIEVAGGERVTINPSQARVEQGSETLDTIAQRWEILGRTTDGLGRLRAATGAKADETDAEVAERIERVIRIPDCSKAEANDYAAKYSESMRAVARHSYRAGHRAAQPKAYRLSDQVAVSRPHGPK